MEHLLAYFKLPVWKQWTEQHLDTHEVWSIHPLQITHRTWLLTMELSYQGTLHLLFGDIPISMFPLLDESRKRGQDEVRGVSWGRLSSRSPVETCADANVINWYFCSLKLLSGELTSVKSAIVELELVAQWSLCMSAYSKDTKSLPIDEY